MKTSIPWLPIFGAVGALALVKIVGHYFGTTASLIALTVLLLLWGLAHVIYQKQLDKLEAHWRGLDEEQRKELLARAGPGLRKDLEKRVAVGGRNKKSGNQ